MTNRIAAVLFALIVLLLAADHFVLHWNLPLHLGRAMVQFVEYASFWRK
ncbi:hypothetical protein [Paracoccus suum]|nr:hypothetical protein [Paracoccus suum]